MRLFFDWVWIYWGYISKKRYRIYCPSSNVREITGGRWDKARKITTEDRYKNANGVLIDAFNSVCGNSMSAGKSVKNEIENSSIDKDFLIVLSTKSYNEALSFAKRFSEKMNIQLKLRGLHPSRKTGLSFSRAECADNEYEYPCYVPRGRYDDGAYVSIEYSSAYENFRGGYYIVVAASGSVSNGFLRSVRRIVKDAYVKKSRVYMGCMH